MHTISEKEVLIYCCKVAGNLMTAWRGAGAAKLSFVVCDYAKINFLFDFNQDELISSRASAWESWVKTRSQPREILMPTARR